MPKTWDEIDQLLDDAADAAERQLIQLAEAQMTGGESYDEWGWNGGIDQEQVEISLADLPVLPPEAHGTFDLAEDGARHPCVIEYRLKLRKVTETHAVYEVMQ